MRGQLLGKRRQEPLFSDPVILPRIARSCHSRGSVNEISFIDGKWTGKRIGRMQGPIEMTRVPATRPTTQASADAMAAAPEHGKCYVIVQTFRDNLIAANKVRDYFGRQGYRLAVAAPKGTTNYLVRTSKGLDKPAAEKLAIELDGVMAKMTTEVPGLVRYKPNDPACKPFVRQYEGRVCPVADAGI